jgi:hypothetical protein
LIKVQDQQTGKLYYLNKFNPASHTTIAPHNSDTDDLTRLAPDNWSRGEIEHFWTGEAKYQGWSNLNMKWKGGPWGRQNIPTLDPTWCYGVVPGDFIRLYFIKSGIIPYGIKRGQPYNYIDEILPGTENEGWSCNVQLSNDEFYSTTVTNDAMPQEAIDVFVVTENDDGEMFVKTARRGNNLNTVDNPGTEMLTAGEHMDPINSNPQSGVLTVKQNIRIAISEELGADITDIQDSYCVHMGTFETTEQDMSSRDPRYGTYLYEGRELGFRRRSKTNLYLIYMKFSGDRKPIKQEPTDNVEVTQTYWRTLNECCYIPVDRLFIEEHANYPHMVSDFLINDFPNLSEQEREDLKLFKN